MCWGALCLAWDYRVLYLARVKWDTLLARYKQYQGCYINESVQYEFIQIYITGSMDLKFGMWIIHFPRNKTWKTYPSILVNFWLRYRDFPYLELLHEIFFKVSFSRNMKCLGPCSVQEMQLIISHNNVIHDMQVDTFWAREMIVWMNLVNNMNSIILVIIETPLYFYSNIKQ